MIRSNVDGKPISRELIVKIKQDADSLLCTFIENIMGRIVENHNAINECKKSFGVYERRTLTIEDYPKGFTFLDILRDAHQKDSGAVEKRQEKGKIKSTIAKKRETKEAILYA